MRTALKSAGERNMLRYLQDCGRVLLHQYTSCPDGLVKPANDLLPCLWFSNGMNHPMAAKYPPQAVYFEYQGETWRLSRGQKRWQRV